MVSLPDLRAWEIAALVIEEGSMTVAAVKLGMTQSAVSQAMKRAETQVGTELVYREHRPLTPTESGRILVAQMREVSLCVDRAVEAIRAASSQPQRQDLRLGMVDTFASAVGPLLVRELLEGAISLRMTAYSGLTPDHAEALLKNAIDAAVTSDRMDGLEDLNRFPLFREPFVLVVPFAWADKLRGRPLREILLERTLVRYSARSHMGMQVDQHLRRLRITHPQMLAFDTSDSLLAMVAGGLGVAITTPLCVLQGVIHRPALEVMPLPRPGFSRELMLMTRRGELDMLGPRIANASRMLLRKWVLPQIVTNIPWMSAISNAMIIEETPNNFD